MKANLFLLLLAVCWIPSFLHAQTLRGDGLKSSIVKYEMIAQDMKIPMTEYRDDYGKKVCTKMEIMGGEMGYIMNGDKAYMVNYSQRQYMVSNQPKEEIDYNEMTPEAIEKFKIKATGTGKFLGKDCTIYTSEMEAEGQTFKMEAWVYKGIALKTITKMDNGQASDQRIATSIEENPVIPANVFEVPTGYSKMALPMPN